MNPVGVGLGCGQPALLRRRSALCDRARGAAHARRVQTSQHLTYWWPAHRPDYVVTSSGQKPWSPTAVTNAGDLAMVTLWATRGFVLVDPNDPTGQSFILTETD